MSYVRDVFIPQALSVASNSIDGDNGWWNHFTHTSGWLRTMGTYVHYLFATTTTKLWMFGKKNHRYVHLNITLTPFPFIRATHFSKFTIWPRVYKELSISRKGLLDKEFILLGCIAQYYSNYINFVQNSWNTIAFYYQSRPKNMRVI